MGGLKGGLMTWRMNDRMDDRMNGSMERRIGILEGSEGGIATLLEATAGSGEGRRGRIAAAWMHAWRVDRNGLEG